MSKKKKILIIVSIVLLIWLSMLTTDVILTVKDRRPVFAIETERYDDGGSIRYTGLLYQVYDVKAFSESPPYDVEDKGLYLVPCFFSIDYVKRYLI